MNQVNSSLFFLAILISYQTFAYTPSEGKVSAIIGPYLYKTNFSDSAAGAHSPYFGDIGLIAQGDLNSNGGLEIGIFHMNKLFFRESGGNYIAEKTELISVTLGYRYWMNPYLAAGLSFYSSYSIGNPVVEHSDFPLGGNIDTSARDTTEYGFDLSLQSEVWSRNHQAIILDARYSISVTNKENEQANHYALLIGYKYMIQEKYPEKPVRRAKPKP
ncbi:MAG: hypothetical protein H7328_00630 [Bdellovibrio sp.]|nr:hypothetical protein [Bdellovibrio sp.]